jgi:hypothetical protein
MTLALQVFKNSNNTPEKLRLNLHSLSVSVSELLEYGRLCAYIEFTNYVPISLTKTLTTTYERIRMDVYSNRKYFA